ncbi:inositol monophosphatase [beta proteobacterium MWH-UniP1]
MANHQAWFSDVCELAQSAARKSMERARSHVAVIEKGQGDWASDVDLEIEEEIRAALNAIAPGTLIHGEEAGQGPQQDAVSSRYVWHVDPIDGSANYVRGIPHYATVISLTERLADGSEEVVMGVTADPCREECFAALQGEPTTLNGQPVRVSAISVPISGLLAVVTPKPNASYVDFFGQWFTRQLRTFGGVRRSGAMAIDLAWVSCGRLDAFVGFNLAPWDIRAGLCQVTHAGGVIRTPKQVGEDPSLSPVAPEFCLAANSEPIFIKLLGDLNAGSN